MGEEFDKLHPAVRKHYAEPAVDISGTMDSIHVKDILGPLTLVSYKLLGGPVPIGGRDVEFALHNRIDSTGTLHWVRKFFRNASFPMDVTFASHTVYSGDHRVIEFTRFGMGAEAVLSVDGGSLLYEVRNYVIRTRFPRLLLRIPAWLSPFGGGVTREAGDTDDSFRIGFTMTHPVLGHTLGYSGRCMIYSP